MNAHHSHRRAGARRGALMIVAAGLLALALAAAARAATITIVNTDSPGEGFNDPTSVVPVGGNPGTTVGAQRLYVFQYAASIWASILPSSVQIFVDASFDPLTCSASSGVLGSAAPTTLHANFSGAPFTGTWYHQALANKLAGTDLAPGNHDIVASFNSGVGAANCLPMGWYYGVDGNEGGQIELLPVVLHELGHGLGFSTSTDGATGQYATGLPHVWDHFLYDDTAHLHWNEMTSGQRMSSAINCLNLSWDGANVIANAPHWLGAKSLLHVNAPAAIVGDFAIGAASFGPALSSPGVTGAVVLVNDGVPNVTNGCEAYSGLTGKIALIDRGTCSFTTKVKNAQNAGAIAAIIADSVAGCPPAGMGGSDPSITIPSVRITQNDGVTLKNHLAGLNVTLRLDATQLAGADAAGRVLLYTPNPYLPGSSVSHWDTSAQPDLLMEPAISTSLSHDTDLTVALFQDIGWFPGGAGVIAVAPLTRLEPSVPNPALEATAIHFVLGRAQPVAIAIYDPAGRRVTRIAGGQLSPGEHVVRWDGRDAAGHRAPAGVYLVRLESADVHSAERIVLMR
jgi:hypothetical protein